MCSEVPQEYQCELVACSKLLLDLAVHSVQKHTNELVIEFIEHRHPIVLRSILSLVEASVRVSLPSVSDEEQESTATNLRLFLQEVTAPHPQLPEDLSIRSSTETLHHMLEKFHEKIYSHKWKKFKEENDLTCYELKESGVDYVAVKGICTINSSVRHIFDTIKSAEIAKKANAFLLGCEELFHSEHYSEVYVQIQLPFPLSNRDTTVSQWDYCYDDTHASFVIDDLPGKVERKRGFVRTKTFMSGWDIISISSHSSRVTLLSHGAPEGMVPAWAANKVLTADVTRVLKFKKLIEGNIIH